MVIRVLKELSENYEELCENYMSMKKDIDTMNKNRLEMKNAMSEMKNTQEGIKSRLDEEDNWTSNSEHKVEKNTQSEQQKERIKENEDGLRELWDNM